MGKLPLFYWNHSGRSGNTLRSTFAKILVQHAYASSLFMHIGSNTHFEMTTEFNIGFLVNQMRLLKSTRKIDFNNLIIIAFLKGKGGQTITVGQASNNKTLPEGSWEMFTASAPRLNMHQMHIVAIIVSAI